MSDTEKLLERIQQLEADCTDYANDLAILESENDQLHNILDALREPSKEVWGAALASFNNASFPYRPRLINAIRAAVAAAEQEVGRE